MSKNLGDMVANTRTFLDEAQPASWTAAEVLYQVNYAYHYVISKVIEVYQEYYLTTTPLTYSTIANQRQYDLSATFLKVERVEINPDPSIPNSQAQRAIAIKMEELPFNLDNNLLNGSDLYNMGYYLIGDQSAQKIGFVPVPQTTATDNIAVWGIVAPDDLADDSDLVKLPYVDNFAQIVPKLAAANLIKKGQQQVAAGNDLLNEAMSDILNYQTFISERQSDGPNMIVEAAYDDIMTDAYPY